VTLYGSAYTGKGLGVYTGFGVAGAYGGKNSDAEDGKLVQQTGYTAAVAYQVNEKTKPTIRMAHIGVDDDADSELNAMNANVIYN
ncbi:hypothetical protein, partial [Gilvimarinus sp. 1_MG-2023]|uniref:hypothetical protein n=1 Tax=Gilvimarinus sp. 1_MG-2023 TaxID=3062638 RepID=UPI0026E1B588